MDSFTYSEDLHLPLLDDVNGVSLERRSYDRPGDEASNWASAASTVGYGTPGLPNSQFSEQENPTTTNDCFEIAPKVFTPDSDGFEDYTELFYGCNATGLVANIYIYDSQGVLVRNLAQNATLAAQGSIRWDGTTDEGQKARTGYYLLFIETFDSNGNLQQFRKRVVVGNKF
jgi:hypothetical protein